LLQSDKRPLFLEKSLVLSSHQTKSFVVPSIVLKICWKFCSKIIEIKAFWLTFPTVLVTATQAPWTPMTGGIKTEIWWAWSRGTMFI